MLVCKDMLGKMNTYDILYMNNYKHFFLYNNIEDDHELFFYDYCNRIVKKETKIPYVL